MASRRRDSRRAPNEKPLFEFQTTFVWEKEGEAYVADWLHQDDLEGD